MLKSRMFDFISKTHANTSLPLHMYKTNFETYANALLLY